MVINCTFILSMSLRKEVCLLKQNGKSWPCRKCMIYVDSTAQKRGLGNHTFSVGMWVHSLLFWILFWISKVFKSPLEAPDCLIKFNDHQTENLGYTWWLNKPSLFSIQILGVEIVSAGDQAGQGHHTHPLNSHPCCPKPSWRTTHMWAKKSTWEGNLGCCAWKLCSVSVL